MIVLFRELSKCFTFLDYPMVSWTLENGGLAIQVVALFWDKTTKSNGKCVDQIININWHQPIDPRVCNQGKKITKLHIKKVFLNNFLPNIHWHRDQWFTYYNSCSDKQNYPTRNEGKF